MKLILLFFFLNSAHISAYQSTTKCGAEFSDKQWRTFQSAKALMEELSIKTQNQFKEWSKSGKRPKDFPSNPMKIYKIEWVGWGEFLGTGNVAKKSFRSYESAKALIKKLGITTRAQFDNWSQSDQRPEDFPSNPNRAYKTEWVSWGKFLGTGNVAKKNFRSYENAKTLMKELGITTRDQFKEWSRSGKRPDDFPSNPDRVYKTQWKDWGEFLDQQKPKKWMSYRKGQRYVQNMGIRTVKEFLEWIKSNDRPEDFPPNPHIVWSKSWKNTQDFLTIQWVSFKKARTYILLGGVTNKNEYYELRELEDLMDELPPNPATVYAPYWKGWDHFLWNAELSDVLQIDTLER